jgi:hypothetical protein
MSNEYKVGKIVYLMSSKNFSIIPALIVEEVVRKTIESIDISYMIQLAGNKKIINLKDVTQEIFTDIESIRSFMYENTRKSVDKMVELALNKEKECFSNESSNNINITETYVQKNEKDVIIDTVRQNELQVTNNNTEEK